MQVQIGAYRRIEVPHVFIEYRLDLRWGNLAWECWRRYSECAECAPADRVLDDIRHPRTQRRPSV